MQNKELKSVKEASQRWIEEGKKYKNAINDWLDSIYIDGESPNEECPEETRKDMSDYVIDKIFDFNINENYEELRLLFPPDHEPIDWEGLVHCVSQVSILKDNRLIVTVNEWDQNRWVYIIDDNDIQSCEDGIFMFGKSFDKKYFAKVYPDRIDICEGWDGKIINTFKPPKDYGADFFTENQKIKDGLSDLNFESMEIHQVVVFPDGSKIGLASSAGIFILDEHGSEFIQTKTVEAEEDGFVLDLKQPHIDVSPDGKHIAVGSHGSSHLVFENSNDCWVITATIEPRSSYPNLVKFNYKNQEEGNHLTGPQLLLCSCHFSQSAAIALPMNNLTANFTASGYDADESLNYVDDSKWIFAANGFSWGWVLGANDGYLWFKLFGGYQMGYLYVGGTIMDIDLSEDRRKLIVATHSGQVIVYSIDELFTNGMFRNSENKEETRKDEYAITNSAYKDTKRYLFFIDSKPIIW